MEFVKTLFGSAAVDLSDILIYIAIVAVFIIGLACCIAPVLGTRGQLRGAIRSIKSGNRARRSWQEDGFLGKGTLMAHWSAYLNNLFFADGEYHNASNVEDFINEDTVIYGPGRAAFADAVPTLLVSLGFLGTLIGLAQGLSGFDMADSAAAQSSIMTLIPGMKYAFMTSIFGVVGSVAFTLITRAVYGSTEHTIKQFYGAMSRYAGVVSVDPLTQVAIYQQEQTALIQTMAKDLNGAFTENMSQAVRDAVEPVNQSLKTFMTVTSKDQMRFLDAVVMRFVDRMDQVIGGKLGEFGRTLDQTNRSQKEVLDAMRASMSSVEGSVADLKEVQRVAQDLAKRMDGYLEDLRTNQKQTEDGYARIASSVEQMNLVSNQQTSYLKTVSAMQADVARNVDVMTGTINNFTRRFVEENAKATTAMQKASDDLRQTGAHLQAIQQNTSKAFEEELRGTLDSYREYVNQFTKRVDYLAGSISDSLSKMPRAVGETADQFLDQVDRLSQTLDQAQRALNDAVDRLYGR